MQEYQDLYVHPAGALSPSLWDDDLLSEPDDLKKDISLGSSPLPNDVDMLWMENSFNLESLTELYNVSAQDVVQVVTSDVRKNLSSNQNELTDQPLLSEDCNFSTERNEEDEKDFLKIEGIEGLLHDFVDQDVYMKCETAETVQNVVSKNKKSNVKRLGSAKIPNAVNTKALSTLIVDKDIKPKVPNVDAVIYVQPISQSSTKQAAFTSKCNAVTESPPSIIVKPNTSITFQYESLLENLQKSQNAEIIDPPTNMIKYEESSAPQNLPQSLSVEIMEPLKSQDMQETEITSPVTFELVPDKTPCMEYISVTTSGNSSTEDEALHSVTLLDHSIKHLKPILPKIEKTAYEAPVVDFLQGLLIESQANTIEMNESKVHPELIITVDPSFYLDNNISQTSTVDEDFSPQSSVSSPGFGSLSETSERFENVLSPDDSDYIPEVNYRKGGRRRRPRISLEQKKLRKKEQNKNAAIRYREKKKVEHSVFVQEEEHLLEKNKDLKSQVDGIMAEMKYLKGLLRDLYKAKKLI